MHPQIHIYLVLFPVIQLARLSGFSPIVTTASSKHTDKLKSLGATAVFDRDSSASDLAKEIKKLTNEPIKLVYDSISSSTTQQTGIELLAPGGQMAVVGPVSAKADEDKSVLGILGLSRHPDNLELVEALYHDIIAEFLEKGIIKVQGFSILTCSITILTHTLTFSRTRLRSYPTGSLAFRMAWQGWKQTKFRGWSWLRILRKIFNNRYMTCFVVCSGIDHRCLSCLPYFQSQVRYSLKILASIATAWVHFILVSSLT